MNTDWMPGVRYGPFEFGEVLPQVEGVPIALLEPDCEAADWQTFRVGEEDARVSVEHGVIASVECVTSIRYLGDVELIGVPVAGLPRGLRTELKLARSWEDGTEMYEVSNLGLTIWSESGRVASVTVEGVEGRQLLKVVVGGPSSAS